MISIPECTDFDASFGCDPTIDSGWGKLYVTTEILHHSQSAFYEQARCLLLTMLQDLSYRE